MKQSSFSTAKWFAHARSDYDLAVLINDQSDAFSEQICFHAQQAVEKALKAVLTNKNIEFPLIHDIRELIAIAEENGIDIPNEVRSADELTPYAVETRYPGDWDSVTAEEVNEAMTIAEDVLKWAKKLL